MKRGATSSTYTETPSRSSTSKSSSGLREFPDFSKVKTFDEFYPMYLLEHSNRINRRFHFIGSTLVLICFALIAYTGNFLFYFPLAVLFGYGFAWIGHFFFEKNKPATFKEPSWSFMGGWLMYKDMWTGKLTF